jgi:hypothetical protein
MNEAVLMQALLSVIVTWISINFGLPATGDYPAVEIVPQAKILALRYGGLVSTLPPQVAFAGSRDATRGQEVIAVYKDQQRTIYLPEGWTGATPAEVSVLVHELVHHLQNIAAVKYQCAQEREKQAYLAQNEWLKLFGSDLEREFEIDPMTRLLQTSCMH